MPQAFDNEHRTADGTELRVRQATQRHRGVPPDVVAEQVRKVHQAFHLLGEDPETVQAADLAIEHNLAAIEQAMASGAELAAPHAGHAKPGRVAT